MQDGVADVIDTIGKNTGDKIGQAVKKAVKNRIAPLLAPHKKPIALVNQGSIGFYIYGEIIRDPNPPF